ncbi:GNAT family N-acetyltransferase [Lachnoclostridium phytofermentans]|uniref:GCN5-related N-acetyltransferase n=1 Tax=Lachnoclostridium phytofermentans (strain ATCC 700394 / DSM 18823 / ISDg) TaxID=357809 RepID=A9KS43_LACP7|nr:GNAT family N-acetyltransferase [Lachnoclostridium phytofermentans]ABX40674.1 GCN5-related N-acetyltransferase [Lachnoclostridium phytofermentans ISDg]
MTEELVIRMATILDAPKLLEIYAPYVRETAITFEYTVPTVQEFESRIAKILTRYPYLVAEKEGEILGYAYVSSFKERAAYDWAVETTIYINQNQRGSGVGKRLYLKLEEIVKRQNIINMNACIAYPNPGSIAFHEHLGYKTVAHFTKCGYKLDRWYDMIWMEKILEEHPEKPKEFIPINKLFIE